MQYAHTLALVSAAVATLAAAQPHVHQHAHQHVAREAEPEAEPQWGNGHVIQMEDVTPHTEVTQVQTAVQTMTTTAAQQSSFAQHTTIATSVRQSATAAQSSAESQPSSSSGSDSGSGSSGSSSGSPTVKIINKCSKTIWIGEGNDPMESLVAGASPFETPLNGTAISWKMGFDSQASWTANNAEIEFTVADANSMTYDLSLQKGNPFLPYGQKLELSDSSCQPIHCQPNQSPCPNAYNTEADNTKVGQPSLPCSKASIVFTACSG